MAKTKKGFTIIEVVLVLAIAGLIFLMVFIALPALQRSQRNTQREDDISRILTAANDYQTNNGGKIPFVVQGESSTITGFTGGVNNNFVSRYVDDTCTRGTDGKYACNGDQFRDPDGNEYQFDSVTSGSTTISATWDNGHRIMPVIKASCGDEGVAVAGTGERQFALFYVLEGNSITCNDNH